jgi:hypothetical protein
MYNMAKSSSEAMLRDNSGYITEDVSAPLRRSHQTRLKSPMKVASSNSRSGSPVRGAKSAMSGTSSRLRIHPAVVLDNESLSQRPPLPSSSQTKKVMFKLDGRDENRPR